MSEPENQNPESSEITELREQCENLNQQVRTLLYGLVVASIVLAAYLGLSARRADKELSVIRPQAQQLSEMGKREEVGLRAFLGRLVEYSRTHPDFTPILEKYNVHAVKSPAAADSAAPAK